MLWMACKGAKKKHIWAHNKVKGKRNCVKLECIGGKLIKERLTILHCVSMKGEEEKALVLGKSPRGRAFKKLDLY